MNDTVTNINNIINTALCIHNNKIFPIVLNINFVTVIKEEEEDNNISTLVTEELTRLCPHKALSVP